MVAGHRPEPHPFLATRSQFDMKLAVSQICTLPASFEEDLEEYAACGIEYVELWLTKLEQYLVSHSLDDARRLLDRSALQAPVASMQGGLLTSTGAARQAAWDLLIQRLDLCSALNVRVLVVACDVPAPLSDADRLRVPASLHDLARTAEQAGIRVALEFQAGAGLGNNLQTAAALIAEVSNPWLGICLDAFHWAVGPSKTEDLHYLTSDTLAHVQLCDLADQLRETATDRDRILPGDGDLPFETIVQHLRAMDYQETVSVEIMNPRIWSIPARQVADACISAVRRCTSQVG